MLKSRSSRFWARVSPFAVAAIVAWSIVPVRAAWAAESGVPRQAGARPVAADPFHGKIPGDVSDGKGDLPKASNPPGSGEVVQTAMPGMNPTQTRFGVIDDTDRLFLVKVRQAGLWERPTGLMAQQQAASPRLKEIGLIMASDHVALDEEDRFIAQQLNVALPDRPSNEQQSWMREFGPMQGHDFDVTAVKWLRFAHGGVFSAIASVRANTRNEMMRLFAERANTMVNKHMSLLESTGLVQYDNLPHAAIGAPAVALAASTALPPKNPNMVRLPIVALAIVTGLLALVSIRRVVRGSA
ncbi:MAG: putative rane protein [Micromonosporaceae bacterium]|nr:putative rane protein [Micromonosporaceae bacterium]MDT5038903.1 putative rane protein [Micromonosporaceae bacterium]